MLTKASLQTLHFLYNFNLKVQSLRNIEENASIFTVVSMASTFIQTKALALDHLDHLLPIPYFSPSQSLGVVLVEVYEEDKVISGI
ncbi:hypothetical protein QQP08_007394 [Theobroma cacao]|nr:hypothetical protein QQP08_007394 [Theobroma cacao]